MITTEVSTLAVIQCVGECGEKWVKVVVPSQRLVRYFVWLRGLHKKNLSHEGACRLKIINGSKMTTKVLPLMTRCESKEQFDWQSDWLLKALLSLRRSEASLNRLK